MRLSSSTGTSGRFTMQVQQTMLATLSLGPAEHRSDSVRVGGASFGLQAGDLYAISGPARWEVTHEVKASMRDRLSLTLRYAPRAALEGRAG